MPHTVDSSSQQHLEQHLENVHEFCQSGVVHVLYANFKMSWRMAESGSKFSSLKTSKSFSTHLKLEKLRLCKYWRWWRELHCSLENFKTLTSFINCSQIIKFYKFSRAIRMLLPVWFDNKGTLLGILKKSLNLKARIEKNI